MSWQLTKAQEDDVEDCSEIADREYQCWLRWE